MLKVVVVGSVNVDIVIELEHLPSPGETVMGSKFSTRQGGKGASQAGERSAPGRFDFPGGRYRGRLVRRPGQPGPG